MHQLAISEQEHRLFEMSDRWFVAVQGDLVSLGDLMNAGRPGSIIRCRANPSDCIKVFMPEPEPALGCVAGWISEEE